MNLDEVPSEISRGRRRRRDRSDREGENMLPPRARRVAPVPMRGWRSPLWLLLVSFVLTALYVIALFFGGELPQEDASSLDTTEPCESPFDEACIPGTLNLDDITINTRLDMKGNMGCSDGGTVEVGCLSGECPVPLDSSCFDLSAQTCEIPLDPACIQLDDQSCMHPVRGSCIELSGETCAFPIASSCVDISGEGPCSTPVDQSCIDISQKTCTEPVHGSCVDVSGEECDEPLDGSCVDISGEVCSTPIGEECIPSDLEFDSIVMNGPLTCDSQSGSVSPGCIDISGEVCSSPVDGSCIDVSGETCTTPLDDSCIDISGEMCMSPVHTTCIDISGEMCTTPLSSSCIDISGEMCSAPLSSTCIDISGETCDTPLSEQCIPDDLTLNSLVVKNLTYMNLTLTEFFESVVETELTMVNVLMANHSTFKETVDLQANLTCSMGGSINDGCIDISGEGPCTEPIDASCIDISSQACTSPIDMSCVDISNEMCHYPVHTSCIDISNETCTHPVDGSCVDISGESCSEPLAPNCLDISGQTCSDPINASCVDISGEGPCSEPVDGSCIDISGQTCQTPLSLTCLPEDVTFSNLTVAETTVLQGSVTCSDPIGPGCVDISGDSCSQPLDESCIDISGETCSEALGAECIPGNLTLDKLVVTELTVLSSQTVNMTNVVEFSQIDVDTVCANNSIIKETVDLRGALTCTEGASIDPSCVDYIDNFTVSDVTIESCDEPIDESCLPDNVKTLNNLFFNLTFQLYFISWHNDANRPVQEKPNFDFSDHSKPLGDSGWMTTAGPYQDRAAHAFFGPGGGPVLVTIAYGTRSTNPGPKVVQIYEIPVQFWNQNLPFDPSLVIGNVTLPPMTNGLAQTIVTPVGGTSLSPASLWVYFIDEDADGGGGGGGNGGGNGNGGGGGGGAQGSTHLFTIRVSALPPGVSL